MIQRDELVAYCDELLSAAVFQDAGTNGLQVHGAAEIRVLATCTSVSEDFFARAVAVGAQALLVHHGLFWKGDALRVDALLAPRLKTLLAANLSLFAYHLPLDAHPELGNNAQLAEHLGLVERSHDLGQHKGRALGCRGRLAGPVKLVELARRLDEKLRGQSLVLPGAVSAVERVGIISGSGADIPLIMEAAAAGCQVLVTGNLLEQSVAAARELGLGLMACGHYNSEKLGVRALGDHLAERFDVRVEHMDVPNPV